MVNSVAVPTTPTGQQRAREVVRKHLTPRNLVKAFVEGTETLSSLGVAGAFGTAASVFGRALGPSTAGWGIGIGVIQLGVEGIPSMKAHGRNRENTKLVVDGTLDLAMGVTTLMATTGIATVPGAVGTAVLLGGKLLFDHLYK